jgi:release factor glutamine methyltransferase
MLAGAGSPSPERDALMLLMHLVNAPRTLLLAHPERTLVPAEVTRYTSWVNRRAQGEPLPYITGRQTFMGLDLQVDRRTSLVRPSTTCVIEMALEYLRSRPSEEYELLVADVGTGCGAVALALGLFEPRIAHIYAVDSTADVLAVARANGERYLLNLYVTWLMGDGLTPIPEPVDLLVANRPNVRGESDRAAAVVRQDTARYEPYPANGSAGDAGDADQGEAEMAHLSTVITQAPAKLRPGGTLICALDDAQRVVVAGLLADVFAEAHVWFSSPQAGSDGLAVVQLPH